MKTELVPPLLVLALAASPTSHTEPAAPVAGESKLSVSEVGLQSASEFLACARCAPATRKVNAVDALKLRTP
jgi:hypothetical protein